MLKYSLVAFCFLLSIPIFAQLRVTENLRKIETTQQAQQYIDANPRLKPALLTISAEKDSAIIHKRILRQKKGDVFSVGYVTYKVLEAADTVTSRASYIFIDGSEFSGTQLDSLKKVIVKRANDGESFAALSDHYGMDGNSTRGDTEWFPGRYTFPQEFQDAVRQHKVGDIFFVDLPDKQWHYIVKKTHPDQVKKRMVVLRSIGR